jgi:hypothetical protein
MVFPVLPCRSAPLRRLLLALLLALAVGFSGCDKAKSPDPTEQEREPQKRAREQHEAEEQAARANGTDQASAIKNYKGPETQKKQTQANHSTKGKAKK